MVPAVFNDHMTPDRGVARDDAIVAQSPRGEGSGYGRSLLAIAGAIVVLWAGIYVGVQAFILALFGRLAFLVAIPLALAAAAAAIAYFGKRATGRRHIGAGVIVTLIAAVALGFAMAHYDTIPMVWVWPGIELAYVLIALGSGLALGLFLGPAWIRVAGAAAVAGLVAGLVVIQEPESPLADPDRPMTVVEQYEQFAALNADALVSGVDGYAVARVEAQPGAGVFTWMRTPAGGVVSIENVPDYFAQDRGPLGPCWSLADPNLSLDLEPTDSVDDYASWCVADAEGWTLTDGTGFTRAWDGGLVIVKGADHFGVVAAGGGQPAVAEEVAAAVASLRPITGEEMRLAFDNQAPPALDP